MARSVDNKEIIRKVTKKHDISEDEVRKIVRRQFQMVQKVMKEGKYEGARLPYFGLFHVNEKRLQHVKENSENHGRTGDEES